MNTEYFKNLNIYNSGDKLTDPNMLLRLNKRVKELKPNIKVIVIIDYVIYNGKYLTLVEKTIKIIRETKKVKSLEVISL